MDNIELRNVQLPIFVYGTLRPGHGNAGLWQGLATARYDGHARVLGRRLVSNGSFPYLLHGTAGEQTVGTLIFPNAEHYEHVLYRMDALEGVPVHYIRDTIAVVCSAEDSEECAAIFAAWTYTPVNPERLAGLDPVAGNDWNNDVPPRFISYRSRAWRD